MRSYSKRIRSLFLLGSLFCVTGYADLNPTQGQTPSLRGQNNMPAPGKGVSGEMKTPIKDMHAKKAEVREIKHKILELNRNKKGDITKLVSRVGNVTTTLTLTSPDHFAVKITGVKGLDMGCSKGTFVIVEGRNELRYTSSDQETRILVDLTAQTAEVFILGKEHSYTVADLISLAGTENSAPRILAAAALLGSAITILE